MAASYKNSAWFYDRLSRLVYGKALINAQIYLLQFVPKNSTMLIIGGGTGWILDELTKIHSTGLNITYVEVAADMMRLSKERNTGDNKVTFINEAIEYTNLNSKFDVIITPFLFDNFSEQTAARIFALLKNLLKPNGIWLNAGFQLTGKWWQQFLLKSMFIFFRLVCNIEASKLPDIKALFSNGGYKVVEEKTFLGEFVITTMYENRYYRHAEFISATHKQPKR